MAIKDLRDNATQLVSYGKYPALVTRVSIPNVNLLSKKGSILYGTGNPAKSDASIDGTTYQYAEVEALSGVDDVNGKSVLFNDGGGNLSWTNVVDNLTTNDDNKVLSAKVGYDINDRLQLTNSTGNTGAIILGNKASGATSTVAIGSIAVANGSGAVAIGDRATTSGQAAAIAIGSNAKAMATTAIQLGGGTNETAGSFQVFDTPMLVDGKIPLSSISPTITVNEQTGLVLSNGQTDYTMSYDGTVVLGPQAVVTGQEGVAIGAQAVAGSAGIAIGGGAVAGTKGIAIGNRAEAGEEVIQLGQFESKFSFRVGNFDVMGKDGQIPGQRLTNALSSIYQRLDDLGFKQGNIVWNSEITMSNVVLNIAHKNSGYDIYKEGKFCYMDTWFRLDVQSGDALYSELSGLIGTLPKEFWPKRSVISPVGNLIKGSNSYSVDMVYVYIVEDGRILVDQRFGYNLVGISATQRNKYLQFGWETN